MSRVLVVDANRCPLAPCTPRRARLLLNSGKAAVLRRYPFTIILKQSYPTASPRPVRLKLDPGSKTTGAIKAFQARARLASDGLLTEGLLQRLEQADAPRPAGRKRSLTGAQLVREIQRELNRLGYPAGTADGIIGRRTVNAARAFQRDIGLAENGKLTPSLLKALRTAR